MTLLIFYISLALGVSFLCSILEAVLLSITPAFMAQTLHSNPDLGKRLQALKSDIDRPLAAILSLNTIAHTIGAAGAGAQATVVFGDKWIGAFSGVLTLLILVLSEIIPKTLGAVYWRQLTSTVSRTLPALIWLLWPLVELSKILTKWLARGKKDGKLNRDEIAALAQLGSQQGIFSESEGRILNNLFRLRSVEAKDIMTPRTVMFSLPQTQTVEEVLKNHEEIAFTRIPIYADQKEEVTGYIHKDDLLQKAARDQDNVTLSELSRKLSFVSQDMRLLDLFESLSSNSEHIALVEDAYGGVAGIVTLEDIIETLLGLEIVDEYDNVADMQEWARNQREKRTSKSFPIPNFDDKK